MIDHHGRVWFGIGVLASISLALALVARRVGGDDDCAMLVSCLSPLFRNGIPKTCIGLFPEVSCLRPYAPTCLGDFDAVPSHDRMTIAS